VFLWVLREVHAMSPSLHGWQLIDDEMWARLVKVVDLPDKARSDLEQIAVEERMAYPWKKSAPPSEIKAELRKLKRLADKLCEGLRRISLGAAKAILIAGCDEYDELDDEAFLKAMGAWTGGSDTTPFGLDLAALERWQSRLGRAQVPAKDLRPLLRLMDHLDKFLLRYTGRPFARASTLKGNAAAQNDFACEVVRIALRNYEPDTVDDAIKVIITRRKSPRQNPFRLGRRARSVGNFSRK
jgi:hypothetical protein